MAKQRVLVDTCIIIEAFRLNCWAALCNHFEIETVERCVEECLAGDPLAPGRVAIASDLLKQGLSRIHPVDELMLINLAFEREDLPALDDGELHMMAWLHANPSEAVVTAISTTDRAAVRATYVLNLVDKVRSLQDLAKNAGISARQLHLLQSHFSESWLSALRTQLKMGVL
ncbi:hypothetical protein [Pseudomonas sp. NPDC089547]|uniref:hypothetical protein n=1 Tax=Pseudomonas sp. NPDC089547 TaxID=3390652 RepID=UPI003D073652